MGIILKMINSSVFRDGTGMFAGSDSFKRRLDFLQAFSDGLREDGMPDSFLDDFGHWLRIRFHRPVNVDWRSIIDEQCEGIEEFVRLVEEFCYLPE